MLPCELLPDPPRGADCAGDDAFGVEYCLGYCDVALPAWLGV